MNDLSSSRLAESKYAVRSNGGCVEGCGQSSWRGRCPGQQAPGRWRPHRGRAAFARSQLRPEGGRFDITRTATIRSARTQEPPGMHPGGFPCYLSLSPRSRQVCHHQVTAATATVHAPLAPAQACAGRPAGATATSPCARPAGHGICCQSGIFSLEAIAKRGNDHNLCKIPVVAKR